MSFGFRTGNLANAGGKTRIGRSGIFNLLPVPPLDGSKLLLAARIPMAIYMEISRFGFMLLIVGSGTDDRLLSSVNSRERQAPQGLAL